MRVGATVAMPVVGRLVGIYSFDSRTDEGLVLDYCVRK